MKWEYIFLISVVVAILMTAGKPDIVDGLVYRLTGEKSWLVVEEGEK